MSGDSSRENHPARKVDQEELKKYLAEKRESIPALTNRIVAREFSDVTPQTVKDNLEDLAENNEICRHNDGDVILYWYPREGEEGGDVQYSEIIDDSIDYSEIEPEKVPRELAEEIASERLLYYQPRTQWTQIKGISQLGIMVSLGLVILGIGEVVSGSLGLQQETAVLILRGGFVLALLTTAAYVISLFLDFLASKGVVSEEPFPWLRRVFG